MARNYITEEYHPEEVNVEKFVAILQDSFPNFIDNMQRLGTTDRYPEEWMRMFTAWMELDTE